jgi:DNA transformation protein
MTAHDSIVEFLREQLAPLGPIVPRRMFGTIGFFRDGLLFGLVRGDALYLRIDDGNREAFQEAAATPFRIVKAGKAIDLAYWRVPDRLFDEPEELLAWARLALAAARRVAARRLVRPAPSPPPPGSPPGSPTSLAGSRPAPHRSTPPANAPARRGRRSQS